MVLDPNSLKSLKVTELRAELKKRGLPTTGLKQVLVDRLHEELTKPAEPEEQEEEEEEVVEEKPSEITPKSATPEEQNEVTPESAEKAEVPVEEKTEERVEVQVQTTVEEKVEIAEPETKDVETQDAAPTVEVEEAPKAVPEAAEPTPATEAPAPIPEDDVSVPEEAMTDAPATTEEETKSSAPESETTALPAESIVEDSKPSDTREAEQSPQPAPEQSGESASSEPPAPPLTSEPEPAAAAEPSSIPEAVSDDAPPQTVVVEAMDIDPVENLKRKRRSASPPPRLPSGDAEPDSTPPSAKKQRAESPPPRRGRDARFKGLFNDSAAAMEEVEAEDDDEPVEPSIHPATRALYIRNLVRPLQEPMLRAHVLALASRNEEDPPASLIETFYLDSIKSHALIVFDSVTAANRARVGVHNKAFPPEKSRKPLWADFVPEELVKDWIEREKIRGGRWEVIYDGSGDDVHVEHIEAGTGAPGGRLAARMGPVGGIERRSVDISNAPSGPRRGNDVPAGPRRPIVMNLDQLFLSTRAKPKLYYLPVPEDVARERLAKQRRDSRGRY